MEYEADDLANIRVSCKKIENKDLLEVEMMIKFLGKGNDLRTEEGEITKTGYVVMLFSSVFGLLIFLIGRYFYGKSLKKK